LAVFVLAFVLGFVPGVVPALALASPAASSAGAESALSGVLIGLAIILAAGKVGAELAVRLGQPAVLGELVAGIVLGNLSLLGVPALERIGGDASIQMLAQLGLILLLFQVGLEATVGEMLQVGASATLVALLGVAAPFALGWVVGAWFLPGDGMLAHAFLGAALAATSIGITARVLRDLGRSGTVEARIVLGAAVLDDILGLVMLAVVVGAAQAADDGGALSLGRVALTVVKAGGFLVAGIVVGVVGVRRAILASARLRSEGALLAVGLAWCFLLAWLAHVVGLAPIVGAFAAGLVLEERNYQEFARRGERTLPELVHPLASFLVPIFFVTTGMRTDLADFAHPSTLLFALVLTVVAIAGKQVSALGVVARGQRINRVAIGIGMIPRGEVGLIFANVGAALTVHGRPLLAPATFSAVVIMVLITTVITPPLLKKSLGRVSGP
jgi:Kef-type K+ transport system membrane component KefB